MVLLVPSPRAAEARTDMLPKIIRKASAIETERFNNFMQFFLPFQSFYAIRLKPVFAD